MSFSGVRLEIFTDGACSGNPGPAGIGVVIKQDGLIIKEVCRPIGDATNNIAEYAALIAALQEAAGLKATDILVNTDSELMFKQFKGLYKVKHENIVPLFDQVKQLAAGFKAFELRHVPREKNMEADKLSRQAVKLNRAG